MTKRAPSVKSAEGIIVRDNIPPRFIFKGVEYTSAALSEKDKVLLADDPAFQWIVRSNVDEQEKLAAAGFSVKSTMPEKFLHRGTIYHKKSLSEADIIRLGKDKKFKHVVAKG